jgi:glycosyltransferase involved in cell wall biosynthesis
MPTLSTPETGRELHPASHARPVLLLMAYECMPERGSEAYVGWGRMLQAAREFELHVIVSGESYAAIQAWTAAGNALPEHVEFYTPPEDARYRRLKRIPRLFAYNYVAYRHWQRLAFTLAQQLHRKHCFSLVHQVNVCTFREPGYTWQLGIPYLWGPVGGTQNLPKAFLPDLPLVEQFKERARNLTNYFALRKRRVRTAARHAAVLIAANSTNQRDFERVFRRPVELLLETGLYATRTADPARFLAPGPIRLLWSGEFTTRKALPLLLRALAALPADVPFELRILGKGPREAEWKALAGKLGIAGRCSFLGHLPLAEAVAQLDWAHLFVFTSLRDTSGNVVLEALGAGVPVLCFDHQGVADIVTPACGIKVPVVHPGHAIAAIASSIRSLALDRGQLVQLSSGAHARAQRYLWTGNGDRVNSIYRSLVLAGPSAR